MTFENQWDPGDPPEIDLPVKDTKIMYDPPNGWKYGFPKEWKPLQYETVTQTLLRDGYPQKEIDSGGYKICTRFWSEESILKEIEYSSPDELSEEEYNERHYKTEID